MDTFKELFAETGFPFIDWQMLVMWAVVAGLLYLAVYKKFEPLLLVPIAFGALLANLPTIGITNEPAGPLTSPVHGTVLAVATEVGSEVHPARSQFTHPGRLLGYEPSEIQALFAEQESLGERRNLVAVIRSEEAAPDAKEAEVVFNGQTLRVRSVDGLIWADAEGTVTAIPLAPGDTVAREGTVVEVASSHPGGLFHYIQLGIVLELFPPLIFLGVGALTDFGPLIANPRMLLLGAAAQFGVFATFFGARLLDFSAAEAGAIGIIGGADGPTSIFLANKLAPELLAPIAVAAYSYMALVPVIQPPIMRGLTTAKERCIRMKSLRKVTRLEKLIFALMVTIFSILLVPPASPLIAMLMLGNFIRECGVTERLSKSAQNEIINIVTIFLGTSVGITMTGERFLKIDTIKILVLGIVAFAIATAAGVLMARLMNVMSKNKINPLIGSAGVSAVPMAARVSQIEGQRADPGNFLLMHAMGPNVAGVIGTALVAGYLLSALN